MSSQASVPAPPTYEAGSGISFASAAGVITISATGGGGGSPGGSSGEIQYNNSGALGGATNVIIAAGGGLFSSGAINGSESSVGCYIGTWATGHAAVAWNGGGGVVWGAILVGAQLWIYDSNGDQNLILLGKQAQFNGTLIAQALSGWGGPLIQLNNTAGTEVASFDQTGAFNPPSLADSSANVNSLYYSTTQSKLAYKDTSGTVHTFY